MLLKGEEGEGGLLMLRKVLQICACVEPGLPEVQWIDILEEAE